MPVTKVRTPSGDIVKVQHPEGATQAQIIQFAKHQANMPTKAAPPQPPQDVGFKGALETAGTMLTAAASEPIAGLSGLVRLATGGSMEDAANTVSRAREMYTRQPTTPEGKQGIQNVGEFMQPVAQGLHAAEKFYGDKGYEMGGAGGGAIGATIPTALLAILGGVTGTVGKVAMPKAKSAVAAYVKEKSPGIQVLDDNGALTPEAMRVISENADEASRVAGGVMTPDEAKRFNLMQEHGVEPTRANVTQSVDDWRTQQDAMKRDGPVVDRVNQQDARMTEMVDEGINDLTTAQDVVETNSSVWGAIEASVNSADNAVSKAYEAARVSGRADGRVVTTDDLLGVVRSRMGENGLSNGAVSAVRAELQNRGLVDGLKGTNIRISVEEAESIRIYLNQLYREGNPSAKRIVRTMKDALDDDVATAVGKDIFSDARAAKTSYHRMIERARRDKRDKSSSSLLEDIIENKVGEDKIFAKLSSSRSDDFMTVKRFLTNDAGPEGLQAWNNVKAQALREAMERATKTGNEFSSKQFTASLAKWRDSKKFNELFDAKERALIKNIEEIGSYRSPPRLVGTGSGPSGAAIQEIWRQIPLIGQIKWMTDLFKNWKADRRALNPASETARLVQKRQAAPPAPPTAY